MAKLANNVQFRLTDTYGDDRDWVAAVVVRVDAVNVDKLDLALIPPARQMTQRTGIMKGAGLGQWREIP